MSRGKSGCVSPFQSRAYKQELMANTCGRLLLFNLLRRPYTGEVTSLKSKGSRFTLSVDPRMERKNRQNMRNQRLLNPPNRMCKQQQTGAPLQDPQPFHQSLKRNRPRITLLPQGLRTNIPRPGSAVRLKHQTPRNSERTRRLRNV